jgi:putative (di)nucleoside polyphosphate hydrolase
VADAPPEGYRPCAGILLLNRDGLLFIGERQGPVLDNWQMPQGGIDDGETPLEAAKRELLEETGTDRATFLAESATWYCYKVPPPLRPRYWGKRYHGQCQRWFAFRFTGEDGDIDLELHDPEFSRWRWASPTEALTMIVPFKREVYQAVFREFGTYLASLAER